MNHLISCSKVHELIGIPVLHEFGSNFALLGHITHPTHRLSFTDVDQLQIATSFSAEHTERVWTDGSVVHGECFWLANAACAALDETQRLRHCGRVSHWNLSAYVAELWGVIIACSAAQFPTTIYCDCLSVVEQAASIFAGETPNPRWTCYPWWLFLHRLTSNRREIQNHPFWIQWIPAHCYEGIPVEILTEELAGLKGTTIEHILHNRLVDAAAKEFGSLTYTPCCLHPNLIAQQLLSSVQIQLVSHNRIVRSVSLFGLGNPM